MEFESYPLEENRRGTFSGAVLVKRGGHALVNRGFGDAQRDAHVPNTSETVFQIASISKQFTAAAILLLRERGDLSLSDLVSRWVLQCPSSWQHITVHHLLSHTSGMGHWDDYPEIDLFQVMEPDALIRTFQSKSPLFPLGDRWSYSSLGYVLIAHIVEQVSGRPYATFLRENVFQPLGMHSTGAGNQAPYHERRAKGYDGDAMLPSFELDTVGIGTGDIWSTTGDLARWDESLMAGRLLNEESLASMFAAHARVPEGPRGIAHLQYGYGWFLGRLEDHRVIFHTGDNSGFRSFNAWFPDDDVVIVVLANDERANPNNVGVHIARSVLGLDAK